ncbi:SAM-dependent methyltransferase [Streptomyces sp. SM14]|uniref:SAM-dependent methyltransferase n=1 Tax=Streptomyces sp. SM14 TaxID=1736045 RepID=UPI000CD4B0F2|nr:SAM-dependent methyltransferase [Streptomyces sp. SM14]
MIDILVVFRAEDAVLDFLTVLTAPGREETRVLVCGTRETIEPPPGEEPGPTLDAVGRRVLPADAGHEPCDVDTLAAWIGATAAGRPARVWTHSPADNRRTRGRIGRDAAIAATGAGLPVQHAVGYSPYLQCVSDEDRPLTRQLMRLKSGFANQHCGPLLTAEDPELLVDTPRIPAAERFFRCEPEERDRLYALLASLGDEVAAVADPWEFHSSPYEHTRLDATTAWIARHHRPEAGPLVEVGACEGALTDRLEHKGFRVEPTEPNPAFRQRLAERRTVDRPTHPHDLAALAAQPHLSGTAYLLIEMLYYGQDLDLLDDLPTDTVHVALEPGALARTLDPWLARNRTWTEAERLPLVHPVVEAVCNGRAYLSKRGSVGVLLRRRTTG